jgi:colicin import membrane protein
VSQEFDVQLQVWKDLAISKQILMGAATDALGLDAECSTAELKLALNEAIKRAKDAEVSIQNTRAEAERQIAEARQQADYAEKARAKAVALVEAAETARAQAEHQLAVGKEDNAKALRMARKEVAEKEKQLKVISRSLADSPENVVRKLKTLKKQKMDEARLRTQTETKLRNARKDNSRLEAELEAHKARFEPAAQLVAQLRNLHALCSEAAETIAQLSDDAARQVEVPALDKSLLESIAPDDSD